VIIIGVAAIAFSLFRGKITGYAASGTVQVTVLSLASLTVNSNVYFGNSTISNDPLALTSISTEATDNYGTFNNCTIDNGGVNDPGRDCRGMEVENDGNVYINVTINASKTIAQFFDSTLDTGANFTFAVLDGNRSKNETAVSRVGYSFSAPAVGNASCLGANGISIRPEGNYLNGNIGNWTPISVNAYLICGNLSFADGNDTLTVEFNLTIPADEPTGTKSNTFTFTATQVT
jgi:hypothetical protein